MNVMDNIIAEYCSGKRTYREAMNELWPLAHEITERMYKVVAEYRLNEVAPTYIKTWIRQWNEEPVYTIYKADEVELLIQNNMLFLIPKGDRKPIKVIIA